MEKRREGGVRGGVGWDGVKEDGDMGKVIETESETKTETESLKGVEGQKKVVELNLRTQYQNMRK